MKQKKENKISIANILAMAGLAGIGVVTFFGELLHSSDGKPGGAIIWAVVVVAVLGGLLLLAIKAKKAEDNPDKWRYVEWVAMALYVVAAFLLSSSFQRFFYVTSQKDEMQHQAKQEIKAIKSMYSNYESQQRKFLTDAVEQIQNYIASGQQKKVKDELAEYITNRVGSNVDSWAAKASTITKLPQDKSLLEMESKIESWNLLELSAVAASLEEKDSKAWNDVEKKIREFGEGNKLIPVITGGGTTPYRLEGCARFELGERSVPKFAQMLRQTDGNTIVGWCVYVLINLIIILNYLVAARSLFVGPKPTDTIGGIDL